MHRKTMQIGSVIPDLQDYWEQGESMSGKGDTYRPVDREKFEENFEKIFDNKEHEHAEAMRAFAAGEKLEFRPKKDASFYGSTDEWYPCDNPDFHHNFEYRIKRDD